MLIQVTNSHIAPNGSIHEVLVKIEDWYIIRGTEGYHEDHSHLREDDIVLYEKEPGFFIKGKPLPGGFTFIEGTHCKELDVSNNKKASTFLEREY